MALCIKTFLYNMLFYSDQVRYCCYKILGINCYIAVYYGDHLRGNRCSADLFGCIAHTEMLLKYPHNLLSSFLADTLNTLDISFNGT